MTLKRPQWANATPEMQDYYDHYWGFPIHDDQQLFAMFSLELFQAGLPMKILIDYVRMKLLFVIVLKY